MAHEVHPGLGAPGHQPQGEIVPRGQDGPGDGLPTQRGPDGRGRLVLPVVELDEGPGVAGVPGPVPVPGRGLGPHPGVGGVGQGEVPPGLGEQRVGAEQRVAHRGLPQQAVHQEEAEVELNLVLGGGGLHCEVAVRPHGDKVVLPGIPVGVDDHAVVSDGLAAEVHEVNWEEYSSDEVTGENLIFIKLKMMWMLMGISVHIYSHVVWSSIS